MALLVALGYVAPQFPVPDISQQFKAFNPNYEVEKANFTAALEASYYAFETIVATHPGTVTTCMIQRLTQAKLQLLQTANFSLGWIIMAEIKEQLATPPESWPDDGQSPVDGGWGLCYHGFNWRLEVTQGAVAALAEQGRVPAIPVTMLDQVNSPTALLECLRSNILSDVPRTGTNTYIAANQINSNLVRMIHRGRPANYAWHPALFSTLKDFTFNEWRNQTSGYWGPSYAMADGNVLQVPDLSTTFHIVKYYTEFGIDMGMWTELAQTTVDLWDVPFPWGQNAGPAPSPGVGVPFVHNMYDVATLFGLAWPGASHSARAAMAAQSQLLLNFTLSLIDDDGVFPTTPYSESVATEQYFGAGTLVKFGFFSAAACFWAAEAAPGACMSGYTYESRRVLYDRMAGAMLGALAANRGKGGDYYDALEGLGLVMPLEMRSGFNGSSTPSPSPPPAPPSPSSLSPVAVAARLEGVFFFSGFAIACAIMLLVGCFVKEGARHRAAKSEAGAQGAVMLNRQCTGSERA